MIIYLHFNTLTDYRLDDRSPTPDNRDFSLRHDVQISTGVHSYTGTGDFFAGSKVAGESADHSPPSSADFKTA
jgi:hypothetical protein